MNLTALEASIPVELRRNGEEESPIARARRSARTVQLRAVESLAGKMGTFTEVSPILINLRLAIVSVCCSFNCISPIREVGIATVVRRSDLREEMKESLLPR